MGFSADLKFRSARGENRDFREPERSVLFVREHRKRRKARFADRAHLNFHLNLLCDDAVTVDYRMIAGGVGTIDADTADCDCCKHRETKKRRFQDTRPQYSVAEAAHSTQLLTNAFQAMRFFRHEWHFPPHSGFGSCSE